jgi:hypothetical protein
VAADVVGRAQQSGADQGGAAGEVLAVVGSTNVPDGTENEARFLDRSRTRSWTVEVRVS